MRRRSADAFPALFNLVLGVTNGHLVSLAAMHCPAALPPALRCGPRARGRLPLPCGSGMRATRPLGARRHHAGPVITFASVAGLTLGSLASLLLTTALQGGA